MSKTIAKFHCNLKADSKLTFRAAASLDSLGWVAVGFSDYGALAGADLCVVWRDWRGGTHMADVHTDEASTVCRYCRYCRYCKYCKYWRYCRYFRHRRHYIFCRYFGV